MQYTRNTVTGSSTADVIVLLVDARNGVVEQTRRHLAVASLLRVPHVILVVNKIDLVDYSEDVFIRVATDFALLARSLGVLDTHCIPVSATEGDNVVTRSTRTPWYDGPTVLGYLENVDDTRLALGSEFRFPVQHVVRPQIRRAGAVGRPGPAGRRRLPRLRRARSSPAGSGSARRSWCCRAARTPWSRPSTPRTGRSEAAVAGQSVVIRLATDIDVSRGDILAATDAPPAPVRDLTATVCWLAERELTVGARVLVQHGTSVTKAIVKAIEGALDLDFESGAVPGWVPTRLARAERHRPGPAGAGHAAADRLLPRAPRHRRLHHRRRGGRLDARRRHGRRHVLAHHRSRFHPRGICDPAQPERAADHDRSLPRPARLRQP